MSNLSSASVVALCLLIAQMVSAGEIEEIEGASARDRVAASRGLVLVDLYAEW